MKWMSLTALSMALCLAALPVLFSREETAVQPVSQMEMQQEIKPVTVKQKQQAAPMENSSADQPEPFRILDRSTGKVQTVPVQVYVTGALCSEMPATFHKEALKAQAVSAHTWALYCQKQARQNGQPYDFSADPSRWQGYVTEQQARERFGSYFDEYWGRVSQAAQSVDRQILVDSSGQPIVAAYHAISAGKTEPAQNVWGNELPCLTAVDSAGDRHAPGYEKTTTIPIEQLRQKLEQTGKVQTVPVQVYVTGALCSEMPATFHKEALKAQAVSAHTWALYCQKQARQNGQPYDFSADPSRWQGYVTEQQARERFGSYFDEYWGRVSQAAQSVDRQILVDSSGQPIVAAYHAISAGKTEPAQNVWGNELPCLTAVDSAGDRHAPGYEKTTTIPIEQLRQKLEQKLEQQDIWLSDDPAQWLAVLERSDSGYVTRMQVGESQQSGLWLRELLGLRSSDFVRELLGLRSSDFDWEIQDGNFVFTTRGYGHGVGLSQYGADYLARQGKNYREILAHYYTGAVLQERSDF